jgi:hypothetical protein
VHCPCARHHARYLLDGRQKATVGPSRAPPTSRICSQDVCDSGDCNRDHHPSARKKCAASPRRVIAWLTFLFLAVPAGPASSPRTGGAQRVCKKTVRAQAAPPPCGGWPRCSGWESDTEAFRLELWKRFVRRKHRTCMTSFDEAHLRHVGPASLLRKKGIRALQLSRMLADRADRCATGRRRGR